MMLQTLSTHSSRLEKEWLISLYAPEGDTGQILRAITQVARLKYGNYDDVAFVSSAGTQQFRPISGSHLGQKGDLYRMDTVEIRFSIPQNHELLDLVIEAISAVHCTDEPVVHIQDVLCSRSKHLDDNRNPHRLWNRKEYRSPKAQRW